ncbi:MAG: ATP-binding protein [Thermoanaerobaculia bacterium]
MHPTQVRQIHLTIGSRFENIELVQVVVDDALQQGGASEDFRHWIGLALREAIANAIKHGNRQDPDKRVDVEAELGEEFILRVADEGEGFDPARIPDPLAPENRFRGDGRGVFYMRKFMDSVDYAFRPSGGTVVTLRKRFTPLANGSQER